MALRQAFRAARLQWARAAACAGRSGGARPVALTTAAIPVAFTGRPRLACGLGAAGLALALGSHGMVRAQGDATVQDPATGLSFQRLLTPGWLEAPLELLGVGCRYKWGLVKVYSVGLYRKQGDPAGRGSPQPLADFLAKGELQGLLIKMYRDVSAETMAEAINEALKPRMLASPSADAQAVDAALGGFKQLILDNTASSLVPGTELLFVHDRVSGTTVVAIDGKDVACLPASQRALALALLHTYTDDAAVSPEAKTAVLAGLAQK